MQKGAKSNWRLFYFVAFFSLFFTGGDFLFPLFFILKPSFLD